MLEAVGHRHVETFFAKCHEVLKKDGLLGLQVIAAPDSRYDSLRKGVDWIQKHIFPGSLLPSIARINRAINRTGDMSLHDIKDLGLHYRGRYSSGATISIAIAIRSVILDLTRGSGVNGITISATARLHSQCETSVLCK